MGIKNDEIYLVTRTRVMTYALQLENGVNDLLLSYLTIFDKAKTKNFGNKAGISFQSKINLLYDINVLTKEEHLDLELLMIFRNKFLHDIECNTFQDVVGYLENSIVNRFKKHANLEFVGEMESLYENACLNLHIKNLKVLRDKFKERTEKLELRSKFVLDFVDAYSDLSSMASSFNMKLIDILSNSDLENEEVNILLNPIIEECVKFSNDLSESKGQKFITTFDSLTGDFILGLLK